MATETTHGTTSPGPGALGSALEAFGERREERERLVHVLQAEDAGDAGVLEAIRRVPRHAFVPRALAAQAYANIPLPIGAGQTISQPYIVAAMTSLAKPLAEGRVLEIGTGSGYQAAVLAELFDRVYSVEYLPEVARHGEANLRALGYGPERVVLRVGDGYSGWPAEAPFDAIVVTAAPEHVPPALLDQLAVGARLVIPIGNVNASQYLEVWQRLREGSEPEAFRREVLYGVRFVPLLGRGASFA
jgi:protein-L-isoaspartate(D-aspartate) O-methyltransferase